MQTNRVSKYILTTHTKMRFSLICFHWRYTKTNYKTNFTIPTNKQKQSPVPMHTRILAMMVIETICGSARFYTAQLQQCLVKRYERDGVEKAGKRAMPGGIVSPSSGAVWESRWPSWAPRPNEPYGFRGRKVILNHAHALVSACP